MDIQARSIRRLRRAVGFALAIPALVAGGLAFVAAASPASAAPFGCTSNFYYSAGATIRAVLPDGTEQTISTGSYIPNTIAMTSTGALYSFTPAAGLQNHLHMVAADGTVTDLGTVAGLATVTVFAAGFTDQDELIVAQGNGRVFRVDIGALTATEVTTADTAFRGDIVEVGGQIYGSGGTQSSLQRVDLTTGAVTAIPISGAVGVFGYAAMWSVGGHLYGSNSTSMYEFLDFETGTARRVLVRTTLAAGTDGASCLAAPSPFLNAADDDFQSTPATVLNGGSVGNVFTNDTIAGQPFAPADVAATITDDDGTTGVSIAADGTLSVPVTNAPGTYTLTYRICRTSNADICDTATAAVTVGNRNILDSDNDGLTDAEEAALNTDPTNPDTDGDKLKDGDEVKKPRTLNVRVTRGKKHSKKRQIVTQTFTTDPTKNDTDGDGLDDGQEVLGVTVNQAIRKKKKRLIYDVYLANPTKQDTDGDGLSDAAEVSGFATRSGFCRPNPADVDTDWAGKIDGVELTREKGSPQNPCIPDSV